jgi:hypothetical protein
MSGRRQGLPNAVKLVSRSSIDQHDILEHRGSAVVHLLDRSDEPPPPPPGEHENQEALDGGSIVEMYWVLRVVSLMLGLNFG